MVEAQEDVLDPDAEIGRERAHRPAIRGRLAGNRDIGLAMVGNWTGWGHGRS
jgi:hypothetical protein